MSELARCFEKVPQQLINVPVSRKPPLNQLAKVAAAIRKVEDELANEGRVLVRYSGTENKVRVMVEGPNPDRTEQYAQDIADALRAEIGT